MVRIEELDRIDDEEPTTRQRRQPPTDEVAEVEVTENPQPPLTVEQIREQYQPTPLEKFMAICKSLILRALVIYFVMSFIRGSGNKTTTTTAGVKVPLSENAFPNGTVFTLYVHITQSDNALTNENLIWKQEGLVYGDWLEDTAGILTFSTHFALEEGTRRNGSFSIHTVITPIGVDPTNAPLRIHSMKQLNKFKRKKLKKTKNLISGEEREEEKEEICSHYHPNLTLNFVTDWTSWAKGGVPVPLNEMLEFTDGKYLPVLFYNDYWNLGRDYAVVDGNETLPITLTYQPLSLFKWQLYAAQNMRNQWNIVESDQDDDTLKEAMIDTNPYLLGLTFVVSILHSIFEFLAFKNDIQFWNNRKSLEGLSVRSVFFNVFQSLIVLLYVLDNETNFVIKVSCFVGLAIELWKINKVTDVKLNWTEGKLLPSLEFADKSSYSESSTKQYDQLAFRYLSWLCFPLLFGYGVYSLVYLEHKNLYSFVLSLLYGYLLTFGFIMMTPQLFINYKLQSVAHLPWRMLTYKFLNTFIDDVFAFVIKMPMLYRIGTLRDDIIFFVYLYQKWCYKVDYKRVNEFGWVQEEVDGGGEVSLVSGVKELEEKKKE